MSKINQSIAENALGAATALDRHIPPIVFILTGAVAVIGSNSLVLSPIAPDVAAALDTSVPGVMTASAAFGLGAAASALFLARYIDRIGAWRMLRFAFAALALSLAASAAAPFVSVLVAAQLAAGLAAGVALPAIYANAADVAPAGRENETVGIVLTGWTLSLVAGVSLSAVLADFLHWRAVYACVGALAAAASAVLLFNRRRDTTPGSPASAPFAALAIPGVARLLTACGAFMAAFYGTYAYLGGHLHGALGQPLSANGLVTLVYGLGFGGAVFLDGAIQQRLAGRNILPLAFLAVGVVYLAMIPASASYTAMLVCALLWGLANHCGLNVLIVRLTAIDPARRGAIMGLNSAVTYLAAFAGTLAFGPLYGSLGFSALATAAALLMAVAILVSRGGQASGD